jgi:hypothetical protein
MKLPVIDPIWDPYGLIQDKKRIEEEKVPNTKIELKMEDNFNLEFKRRLCELRESELQSTRDYDPDRFYLKEEYSISRSEIERSIRRQSETHPENVEKNVEKIEKNNSNRKRGFGGFGVLGLGFLPTAPTRSNKFALKQKAVKIIRKNRWYDWSQPKIRSRTNL